MNVGPQQPAGDPQVPLISLRALLLILITGLVIGAAIAWPPVGAAIAVGVGVLAVLIVITGASGDS